MDAVGLLPHPDILLLHPDVQFKSQSFIVLPSTYSHALKVHVSTLATVFDLNPSTVSICTLKRTCFCTMKLPGPTITVPLTKWQNGCIYVDGEKSTPIPTFMDILDLSKAGRGYIM